jgi:hypothetical protein
VRSTKSGSAWCGRGRGWRLGGIMGLALLAAGCGGSSSSQFTPFAGVWVANGAPNVLHFGGVLINSGTGIFNTGPSTLLDSAVLKNPQDTLFSPDFSGIWVVDGGNAAGTGSAVYEFSFAQLANLSVTPAPSPVFTIAAAAGTTAFFGFPQFGAFDANENLWISDSAKNEIFEFTAAQLASPSGVATTPAATLVGAAAGVFNGPLGIVFDKSNNLWVANNGGTTIIQISAKTIESAVGTTPVAASTILNTSVLAGVETINNPWAILFDGSGDLWLSNEQTSVSTCYGSVVEFPAANISGGGTITPTPSVEIIPTAINGTTSLCDPNGLAMDAFGNITVANAANSSLSGYLATQITVSGPTVPKLFVQGASTGLDTPAGLTYGPFTLE